MRFLNQKKYVPCIFASCTNSPTHQPTHANLPTRPPKDIQHTWLGTGERTVPPSKTSRGWWGPAARTGSSPAFGSGPRHRRRPRHTTALWVKRMGKRMGGGGNGTPTGPHPPRGSRRGAGDDGVDRRGAVQLQRPGPRNRSCTGPAWDTFVDWAASAGREKNTLDLIKWFRQHLQIKG